MTSSQSDQSAATGAQVRPLTGDDLDRCVAIDQGLAGRARRGFFESRLAAAIKEPRRFIYVGATDGDALAGFVLVRLLEGEYGGAAPVAVLDAIGVDGARQGGGFGRALIDGVEDVMRSKGITELRSQLDWTNHGLMRFLAQSGFRLAPRVVLSRDVADPVDFGERLIALDEGETTGLPPSDAGVPDYSDPHGDDAEALSRDVVPVRSMIASDIAALVRIDRKVTGRDRRAFFENKVAEVLEESGIRISLVAEPDGLPVGFIMARLDVGEFGNIEPEAVIDTMGVDPDSGYLHVGSALMSQLFANLNALRVERARTQIRWGQLDILSFLESCGFAPSQRIALERFID